MPCAAAPNIIPLVTGLPAGAYFKNNEVSSTPVRPVAMTRTAVIAGSPPSISVMFIAIGVVIERGARLLIICGFIPSSLASPIEVMIATTAPPLTLMRISTIYARRMARYL